MSAQRPRIWVLLGHRRGDNNQLLALAEGLRLPFETRTLAYRKSWPILLKLLPTRPHLLTSGARRNLQPPWPDLVIGIGRRSVAVARWIRAASGGRTKIVRLGNPRAEAKLFDLVITTPQYPVRGQGNVLTLPVSMGRYPQGSEADERRRELAGGAATTAPPRVCRREDTVLGAARRSARERSETACRQGTVSWRLADRRNKPANATFRN